MVHVFMCNKLRCYGTPSHILSYANHSTLGASVPIIILFVKIRIKENKIVKENSEIFNFSQLTRQNLINELFNAHVLKLD
jgi:hypothetical protein